MNQTTLRLEDLNFYKKVIADFDLTNKELSDESVFPNHAFVNNKKNAL